MAETTTSDTCHGGICERMLVRGPEGTRLGRVVFARDGFFRISLGRFSEVDVSYADVLEVSGHELVVRWPPTHPAGISSRTRSL